MSNATERDTGPGRARGDDSRGAPVPGARGVTAILPNGRVLWLEVAPSVTTASDVQRLARSSHRRAAQHRAAAFFNSAATTDLARTIADDAKALTATRLERTRKLRRRLVTRYQRLDRKLSTAVVRYRRDIARQMHVERTTAVRLRRRDLWDKILLLTALPLFAAYGQVGQPFGVHNLTLTLSLLVWLVGDDVVQAVFGRPKDSPYPVDDTDAWSYIAPIGHALTAWWLLGGRQHERFVAGMTSTFRETPGTTGAVVLTANIPLSPLIARDHWEDFQTFTDVPAVASIASIEWSAQGQTAGAEVAGIRAVVVAGDPFIGSMLTLEIHITTTGALGDVSPVKAIQVAWMIDTQKPADQKKMGT